MKLEVLDLEGVALSVLCESGGHLRGGVNHLVHQLQEQLSRVGVSADLLKDT